MLAVGLFLGARKGWIDDNILQRGANIAGIVAMIAALVVIVSPLPTSLPSPTNVPYSTIVPTTIPTTFQTPPATLSITSSPASTPIPTETLTRVLSTFTPTVTSSRTSTPTITVTPTPSSTPAMPQKKLSISDFKGDSRSKALYSIDTSTGIQTLLFIAQSRYETESQYIKSAAWSPDGSTILITHCWGDWVRGQDSDCILEVANNDGTNSHEIARAGRNSAGTKYGFYSAIWSLDGRMVTFGRGTYYTDNGLYTMNLDGSGLSRHDDLNSSPLFWSTDGKWVIAMRLYEQEPYAVDVQNNRRVPLTQLAGISFYDERYYPWRRIDQSVCKSSFEPFWACQ